MNIKKNVINHRFNNDRTYDQDDLTLFMRSLDLATKVFPKNLSILISTSTALNSIDRTYANIETWFRDLPNDVGVMIPRGKTIGI